MPSGKPSPENLFQYWVADIEGNTEYTGTDNVSEDITVYAVGISPYGKSSVEKLISTSYGRFSDQINIKDLSVYTAYACGVSTAGNFNYSIVSVDKDGDDFDYSGYILTPSSAMVNTDALFVMPGTPVGTYTVTIEATEKEPVFSLMSADYDIKPFTFTVTVTVNKADPEFEIPQNLSADYEQSLSDIELPEGFAWADGTQRVESENVEIFEAIYPLRIRSIIML